MSWKLFKISAFDFNENKSEVEDHNEKNIL